MSTQANPVLSAAAQEEAAKKFLARVKSGEEFISKKDFEAALAKQIEDSKKESESREAAFKSAVGSMSEKLTDKLQEIIEAKQAPILGRGKWQVRNRFGNKVEMEYSLTRLTYAQTLWQKYKNMPKEKEYGHEVEFIERQMKEQSGETVTRAVSEGSSTAGGTLIPQEWTDFVIPELGAQVVVMRAGPNVLPMQHQILNIPGLTNNQTCYWIGENSAITEQSPTTNNTTLTLRTAASLTGLSVQWLRDATPETDAALQAGLVRGLARFVDNGYINGTGSTQPTGLIGMSGIGQIYAGLGAANGSSPLYDDFDQAIYTLELANAPRAGRTWLMHPRELSQIRRLKDSLGRPLFMDNLQRENYVGPNAPIEATFRGADGYILGYPVFSSTQIPINQTRGTSSTASTILLVAFSDIYVGQGVKSQGMEVAISDQALFTNAEVAVRLLYRTDIVAGHAASVVALGGCL